MCFVSCLHIITIGKSRGQNKAQHLRKCHFLCESLFFRWVKRKHILKKSWRCSWRQIICMTESLLTDRCCLEYNKRGVRITHSASQTHTAHSLLVLTLSRCRLNCWSLRHTEQESRQKQQVTDDGKGLPVMLSHMGASCCSFLCSSYFPSLSQRGAEVAANSNTTHCPKNHRITGQNVHGNVHAPQEKTQTTVWSNHKLHYCFRTEKELNWQTNSIFASTVLNVLVNSGTTLDDYVRTLLKCTSITLQIHLDNFVVWVHSHAMTESVVITNHELLYDSHIMTSIHMIRLNHKTPWKCWAVGLILRHHLEQ